MPDKDYSHRTLIEKLGIKAGHRVSAIGIADEAFRSAAAAVADYSERLRKDCDVVLLGAEALEDLGGIPKCLAAMKANGGLWIVYPKGRKHITEMQVIQAGLAASVVDTKCSASPRRTPGCASSSACGIGVSIITRAMTIEIHNPELERLLEQKMSLGDFATVEDMLLKALKDDPPSSLAVTEDKRQSARLAGDRIRILRKGVTLDRPEGMSLREYAHIGHKY